MFFFLISFYFYKFDGVGFEICWRIPTVVVVSLWHWWLWVCGVGGCGFVVVMGLCRWWYGCGSVMVLCRGGMVAAVVVVGGRSHTGCVLCIMN